MGAFLSHQQVFFYSWRNKTCIYCRDILHVFFFIFWLDKKYACLTHLIRPIKSVGGCSGWLQTGRGGGASILLWALAGCRRDTEVRLQAEHHVTCCSLENCKDHTGRLVKYTCAMYLCEAVMQDLPGPTAPSWIHLGNIVPYCVTGLSISLEANSVW